MIYELGVPNQLSDRVLYGTETQKAYYHEAEVDTFTALADEEQDHDIKYRTLSWQKATFLLFGEYVCLAVLALAWSWSVLGWVSSLYYSVFFRLWIKLSHVGLWFLHYFWFRCYHLV